MQRDELAAWLRLSLTPGIGNEGARRLLAAFGLPLNVFVQEAVALQQLLSDAQVRALQTEPEPLEDLVQRTWDWLNPAESGPPRGILSLADADYPEALLHAGNPPLLLYTLGQYRLTRKLGLDAAAPSVAVVGNRNPTPQGAANAQAFSRSLSEAGLVVISGLALGVDGAAHAGALEGPSATVAVVGTGLDRVYPKRHLDLAHRIAAQGLVVGEFALGTSALAPNFSQRNRIIAALGQGTLVVEAALQSGSLITARLAAKMGREVFAIPGSIHSPQSRGCHALIRQGAKMVETAQDVLEELGLPAAARAATNSAAHHGDSTGVTGQNKEKTGLLDALGYEPCSLDALQARTGIGTGTLQAMLLELELDGLVARLPGGLFQQARMG